MRLIPARNNDFCQTNKYHMKLFSLFILNLNLKRDVINQIRNGVKEKNGF